MNPWSLYWRQGHSTTFGDYFKQGYVGAVADWWQAELQGLPADPVVLEVGCGNCSLLPAMIQSGVRGRYVGVDIATVQPSPVAKDRLAGSGIELTLHSETPAEEIPEPDASVDLVASVFGIEYSDFGRSLPEAFRLLKPGGRLCALLHHADSVVTARSRRDIVQFHATDMKAVIEALYTICHERDRSPSLAALKTNPRAEQSRERINEVARKYLGDTNPDTANKTMFEFMSHALRFFRMMGAPTMARRQFIESLAAEHQASHERSRQMVSVALDVDGVEKLLVRLREAGFATPQADVVYNDQDILAWGLQADK